MKKLQVTVEVPDDFENGQCYDCPFGYDEWYETEDDGINTCVECVFGGNFRKCLLNTHSLPIIHCKDCSLWDLNNYPWISNEGHEIHKCLLWSSNDHDRGTSSEDFCSYGNVRRVNNNGITANI